MAGKHGANHGPDRLLAINRRRPLVIRIGHLKRVDDHSILPRQDLSVENLQAVRRHDSGDLGENPGITSLNATIAYSQVPRLALNAE